MLTINVSLYINRYQLQTQRVNFEQIYETGFTGLCEYATTNRDRYWLGLAATLAELAFYSGIGHRTTMDLGQARTLKYMD